MSYAESLRRLEEPSLLAMRGGPWPHEAYRFLWVRSFHPTVAIRVDSLPDAAVVTTKVAANFLPDYPPILEHTRTLSADELTELLAVVESAAFWSRPTREPSQANEVSYIDGAHWVFEGVTPEQPRTARYHVVSRWSAEVGDLRELGLALLQLSELDLSETEIY